MFIAFSFFDKIFNKFYPNATAEKFSKISVTSAVITSLVLLLLKGSASFFSNSITLQASTMDSFIDTIASLFALLAIGYAFKDADEDHGFGHGKIEGLTALCQMVFVLFACYNIFKDAIDSLKNPEHIDNQLTGIIVMVISSILVYVLVSLQRYSAHKTKSVIVTSDSLHYSADLLMNFGVFLSLLLANSIKYLDSIAGILVCIYVVISAIKICKHSLQDLMDSELPKKYRLQILNKLSNHKEIIKVVRVRTRSAGTKKIVQADIVIDNSLSFVDADKIAQNISKDISSLFLNSEVLIIAHPNE